MRISPCLQRIRKSLALRTGEAGVKLAANALYAAGAIFKTWFRI